MAVEKMLDLCLLVLVLFLVPYWAPAKPSWLVKAAWEVGIVLVALYVGLRAGLAWQKPLMRRLTKVARQHNVRWWPTLQKRLVHIVDGIEGLRNSHVLWRGVFFTLVAWFWGAAANLATFLALGLPLSWPMALTVSAALRVGVALPSLPANIGVYEGTVVLALGIFGVGRELALSYGVLMHLVDLLPPVALTLGLVWRSQWKTGFSDESETTVHTSRG